MSEILSVGSSVKFDNSIIKKEYHTYTPYTQSFGNNDEVRIAIQSQDLYVLPSDSYILIEFDASFEDGQENSASSFVVGHAAFFFSEIRYELNGVEIDRCRNPGITSILKRYAAYRDSNLAYSSVVDENTNIKRRTYRFVIPLNIIFGFADDYRKIVMNAKHELILIRSRSNSKVYTCAGGNCTVNFGVKKITWKIPHIQLSDQSKLRMLRYLERNQTINVPYRSWETYELPQVPQTTKHIWTVKTASNASKPRYIIVAFLTNRTGINGQSKSDSYFDHCNISDVRVHLNNDTFPYSNLDTNFNEDNFQEAFMASLRMQSSYYGPTAPLNPFVLNTYDSFKQRAFHVIDCSNSDDSLLNSTVDVRIEINARENIPANTQAFCLIIQDSVISYSPFDGIVNKSI